MCTDFDDEPGQSREEGFKIFPVNLANWKKSQPDMPIRFIDTVHLTLLHDPDNLKIIKEMIDSYAL